MSYSIETINTGDGWCTAFMKCNDCGVLVLDVDKHNEVTCNA